MGPSAIAAIGAGVAVAIAVAALLVVVVVRRRHAAFNAEIERRELSGTLASESTWFSGRRPSFYVWCTWLACGGNLESSANYLFPKGVAQL
jgi:uncharacterized protein (TIGR03382 family)